jgi:hypothetical protein
MARPSKRSGANITLVRALPRVRPHARRNADHLRERRAADVALVRPLPRVHANVLIQLNAARAHRAAHVAHTLPRPGAAPRRALEGAQDTIASDIATPPRGPLTARDGVVRFGKEKSLRRPCLPVVRLARDRGLYCPQDR